MRLADLLLLATLLFSIGIYGVLTRRHAVALLLSIELMANAANIAFVAFATLRGGPGEVLMLFALAVTVSEVAVGLALVMLLYRRHGDTVLDLAQEAKR
jgi:NADH-quinone oxidoreductase subunit K